MSHEVALCRATAGDLNLFDRLLGDPDAAGRFAWFGWNNTGRYRRRFEEDGLLGAEQGMLVIMGGEERCGFVSWHRRYTGRQSFCWNVGIGLLPEAQGNGYATEAVCQLVRYLFTHTQMNRVEATTEVDHVAAQRVLEKAGFTREGVSRGVSFRAGRWRDAVNYSVLRDELDLPDDTPTCVGRTLRDLGV